MKIDIQFKNEAKTLSYSPSNFRELVRVIKDMFLSKLRESLEIQYYEEMAKEWSPLDERLYKSLIETPKNIDRIKLRILDQISEDSSYSLIINSKDYEFENNQEKILNSMFTYQNKLKI